ncbi:NMT1/THI5 domain protein [Treponema primitia ZAS-2]|uniref:Thiamine pyrimidine synthase n=1 Tax=Treponema primitia (strain ATCC BAA-887 / DSM 12427 / ZAS-2) TaxID=545694 RepID=F5YM77_TREPZ|nr:ABC transporter substrate-binding protein [Treponema primitia]AEF84789.1 NMT1/THI5 domain protein [Treponema primitia ZAS-2]
MNIGMKKTGGILFAAVFLFTLAGTNAAAGGQQAKDSGTKLDEITIQLKWLPQAQFMGYYVAAAKGYYEAEGLKVNIVPGGGDITETAAVYSGQVDVGVTWVANLIVARANGLDLIDVAQTYQRSGLVLVAKKESGVASGKDITNATKVGNWMGGNEYEIKALFSVLPGVDDNKSLIQQGFDMNDFDNGNITAASAMTYNELGLVVNSYEGALGYGDKVNVIDMNTEGVAMLEDCMFVKESWAKANKDKLVRFIRASLKGWKDACANTNEAAEIVFRAGSSVSQPHQQYMAQEVAKLVTIDTKGATVPLTNLGGFDVSALESTLTKTKSYAGLTDSSKNTVLQGLTVNQIYDPSYWEEAVK